MAEVVTIEPSQADRDLVEAYQRLGNVWKVADELGMVGQTVHRRLKRLGVAKPMNVFTSVEIDRLKADYAAAAANGKLDELAASMGRTKPFICRQARALGLTDQKRAKRYIATWKYVDEDQSREIFERFKSSSLGMKAYCVKFGYDDVGFSATMRKFFADEWDSVIEGKAPVQSWYRYGRQFEYRVRDDLRKRGYYAQRSPASKTPIDVTGIRPGEVLFIQCKRGGDLLVREWNAFFELAISCGAIPILASCPTERGVKYERLLALKDGSRKPQPKEPFEPARITKGGA